MSMEVSNVATQLAQAHRCVALQQPDQNVLNESGSGSAFVFLVLYGLASAAAKHFEHQIVAWFSLHETARAKETESFRGYDVTGALQMTLHIPWAPPYLMRQRQQNFLYTQ